MPRSCWLQSLSKCLHVHGVEIRRSEKKAFWAYFPINRSFAQKKSRQRRCLTVSCSDTWRNPYTFAEWPYIVYKHSRRVRKPKRGGGSIQRVIFVCVHPRAVSSIDIHIHGLPRTHATALSFLLVEVSITYNWWDTPSGARLVDSTLVSMKRRIEMVGRF
jgi:hypothetical protein